MSTNPTDEIEAALDREHVLCDCDEKAGENGGHWASCALRVRGPRIAAFIAKREAGLRKALAEQMGNTVAWQRQAENAADARSLALGERDACRDLLATLQGQRLRDFESGAAALQNLRAQLAARDRELELLREVELVARETRDAMDITLSSDDLDGEWEFENTVPIWHDRLADRLRDLDAALAGRRPRRHRGEVMTATTDEIDKLVAANDRLEDTLSELRAQHDREVIRLRRRIDDLESFLRGAAKQFMEAARP